jgi:glycosyltransferase involved in cell wall biosynthesis
MPAFTALLHTRNDGRRLGRALETLLPCSEIVVVDRGSTDSTVRVAQRYGARVVPAERYDGLGGHAGIASFDWIFCLASTESLTEGLQTALFEWNLLPTSSVAEVGSFSVAARLQEGTHWLESGVPETRLVPREWSRWNGWLPANDESSVKLEGELLQLAFP